MRTPPGLTIVAMFWRANFWSLWSPEKEQNVVDQAVDDQIQDKNQSNHFLLVAVKALDGPTRGDDGVNQSYSCTLFGCACSTESIQSYLYLHLRTL